MTDTRKAIEQALKEYLRREMPAGTIIGDTDWWAAKITRAISLAQQGERQPTFIEVRAEVRYWEDSSVNGVEDEAGTLIPLRNGKYWAPVIRLEDGTIMDWPQGTTADVHFKVCDQGEYWLLDGKRNRIAKWGGYYVPNQFLCHGDNGYGDYIIFKVIENGRIEGWSKPTVDSEQWPDFEPLYAGIAPAAQPVQGMAHPTCKPDMLVNGGALRLALNSLQRGTQSQKEIADELERTATPSTPQPDARKVIEQMVGALESTTSMLDDLNSAYGSENVDAASKEGRTASQAGQQWLKEHK